MTNLSPRFCVYKRASSLFTGIVFKFHMHVHMYYFLLTFSKSSKFASKRTLDYFRKKYPEYANNWLVSQIAVRAETVNVTAHLVGCNTHFFSPIFKFAMTAELKK